MPTARMRKVARLGPTRLFRRTHYFSTRAPHWIFGADATHRGGDFVLSTGNRFPSMYTLNAVLEMTARGSMVEIDPDLHLDEGL